MVSKGPWMNVIRVPPSISSSWKVTSVSKPRVPSGLSQAWVKTKRLGGSMSVWTPLHQCSSPVLSWTMQAR